MQKILTFNQMNLPKSPPWNHIYHKCFDGANFFLFEGQKFDVTWFHSKYNKMTFWLSSPIPTYMEFCIVVLKSAIKVTSCFTTGA